MESDRDPAPDRPYNRREFLHRGARVTAGLGLGSAMVDRGSGQPASRSENAITTDDGFSDSDRPNILLIMTDQHHFEALSCMGHPVVQTPHLDRLASRGTLFQNAYCASAACAPSRASIFSGMFPSAHGVVRNNLPINGRLDPDLTPELLSRAGYHSHLVGKLHFNPAAEYHGFDSRDLHDGCSAMYDPQQPAESDYVRWLADRRFGGDRQEVVRRFDENEGQIDTDLFRFAMGSDWRSAEEHSNTWVTDRAVDFLQNRPSDRPFFLFTSYFGPHHPYLVPEPWASRHDPDAVPLPDHFAVDFSDRPIARRTPLYRLFEQQSDFTDRQCRELLAQYYGQIEMIDDGVGRILDQLDRSGLADNTVVVFTADHGDYAGQFGWFFKATCYSGAVRVPLIVADPRGEGPRGVACERVVNNMDLFPTLNRWAGADRPTQTTMSRDLRPLLDDPAGPGWEDETFSEFAGMNMVVSRGLKLMRYRTDDGVFHELYDTAADPQDFVNLWDRPEVSKRQAKLMRRLDELKEAVKLTS